MRVTRAISLVVAFFLLVAASCDDRDARKPNWWPDEVSPWGEKWPPPRPDDWPEGKLWPPLKEVGDDPAFWAELWGEDIDPETDRRLTENGELGNDRFRYNFEQIGTLDDDVKPGCGLHVLVMLSWEPVTTCTPYPEAKIRQHCAVAFDQNAARQKCRRHCMRNERVCRRGRLIEPPISAYWRCSTFNCFDHWGAPEPCPEPVYHTDCAAFYICDCNEF